MGNSIVGRKTAKVMKIDGETFKLKTPQRVRDVITDHPGHVLLDSEAVKHFGIRAKPLEPDQALKPRRVYFLVDLPRFPVAVEENKRAPRRVRSVGIQMNAKERLECLMLPALRHCPHPFSATSQDIPHAWRTTKTFARRTLYHKTHYRSSETG